MAHAAHLAAPSKTTRALQTTASSLLVLIALFTVAVGAYALKSATLTGVDVVLFLSGTALLGLAGFSFAHPIRAGRWTSWISVALLPIALIAATHPATDAAAPLAQPLAGTLFVAFLLGRGLSRSRSACSHCC